MNDISEAARRIAEQHNRTNANMGGKLAFNADGTGGEWYSEGSWPNAEIIFPVHLQPVTVEQVQERLDGREAS